MPLVFTIKFLLPDEGRKEEGGGRFPTRPLWKLKTPVNSVRYFDMLFRCPLPPFLNQNIHFFQKFSKTLDFFQLNSWHVARTGLLQLFCVYPTCLKRRFVTFTGFANETNLLLRHSKYLNLSYRKNA